MHGSVIKFVEEARTEGLNVGVQESLDALLISNSELVEKKSTFKYALRSVFCTSVEDTIRFDTLFEEYWIDKIFSEALGQKTIRIDERKKDPKGSVVMMGKGKTEEAEEESKSISGANELERLRETDFSKVSEVDSKFLENLADQLFRQMSFRLKRRMSTSYKNEKIDLRKTIRRNIGHGGDLIERVFKSRKKRKPRLVVLLDVSGSMDKYSFFLLRFIYALQENFENLESFIFSTKLRRITSMLKGKGLEETLKLLSLQTVEWSSGTKIGECLEEFNQEFSNRVLSGHSITIILSDGLETGEPILLEREIEKIRMKTDSLIWLNPLKGMTGYQPEARGMKTALPYVNVFRSAHNLNSILELENLLSDV